MPKKLHLHWGNYMVPMLRNLGTWKFWKKTLFFVPSKLEFIIQKHFQKKNASEPEQIAQQDIQIQRLDHAPQSEEPEAVSYQFPMDYVPKFEYTKQTSYSMQTRTDVPRENESYAVHDLAPHNVTTTVYLKKVTETTEPVRIFNRRWKAPSDDYIDDLREKAPDAEKRTGQHVYDLVKKRVR